MGALDTAGSIALGLLMLAVFLAALIAIPLLLIWCINTLGIATASYGIIEWIAAAVLTAFFLGGSGSEV